MQVHLSGHVVGTPINERNRRLVQKVMRLKEVRCFYSHYMHFVNYDKALFATDERLENLVLRIF